MYILGPKDQMLRPKFRKQVLGGGAMAIARVLKRDVVSPVQRMLKIISSFATDPLKPPLPRFNGQCMPLLDITYFILIMLAHVTSFVLVMLAHVMPFVLMAFLLVHVRRTRTKSPAPTTSL